MNRKRAPKAGVTLIEMLLALAVAAMIGVAGFVLLESTVRTQSGVAGELEHLAKIQRTFRLFTIDSDTAISAHFKSAETLELRHHDYVTVWMADPNSITRHVKFPDQEQVTQVLHHEASAFDQIGSGLVALRLTEKDIWRLAHLPDTLAR